MNEVDSLAALVFLVAVRHRMGIKVLTGAAPAPTSDCWRLLLEPPPGEGEKVDGTKYTGGFFMEMARGVDTEAIIEKAGGWGSVCRAVDFVKKRHPTSWSIFCEAAFNTTARGFSRLSEGGVTEIAEKYEVDRKTVYRRLRSTPRLIASIVLSGIIDEIPADSDDAED